MSAAGRRWRGAVGQEGPESGPAAHLSRAIRTYWDERIIDTHPSQDSPGTLEFFAAHDAYRLHKCGYLLSCVEFDKWANRDVLEIGCGAGFDLVRFAKSGARVTGIDVSCAAIQLALAHCAATGVTANLIEADGARLPFAAGSYDLVYCYSVLSFAADPRGIVREAFRVLRPGGRAILMVYNRWSWMNALNKLPGIDPGHVDAPAFRTYTAHEFESLLRPFHERVLVGERGPSAGKWRASMAGQAVDGIVSLLHAALPATLLRPLSWHLMAFCKRSQ